MSEGWGFREGSCRLQITTEMRRVRKTELLGEEILGKSPSRRRRMSVDRGVLEPGTFKETKGSQSVTPGVVSRR